jgi:hypothetical protein
MAQRARALSLYRRIIQAGNHWQGSTEDANYIVREARRLFRKNMHLTDEATIERKLFEAEVRHGLDGSN